VCTTELGYMAKIEPEFIKRNAKLIGLPIDPVDRKKPHVVRALLNHWCTNVLRSKVTPTKEVVANPT